MKVPVSWLREHCDPGLAPEEIAERLSMTGTEVERIATIGVPSAASFVVGRVVAVGPHPDADRLSVCEVETGEEVRTIVCGAPNVAAGQSVAVALPGATLPDGTVIGKAKLRGVVSDGMILSEVELGVGEDAGGIIVLADEAVADSQLPAPGGPLAEALPISDSVLELEVTPNRPDCLGVYGVAREVHAATGAPLGPPPWEQDPEPSGDDQVSDHASVSVEVPDLCPRFTARVFDDVTVGPSPSWLAARLVAAGQRPINNVVDITNYVMLLTSQPLHAFDLDRVPEGALTIRAAAAGERMRTLDDVERTFDAETVLVCDENGPAAVAGIMGGGESEVSGATSRVLLEVATWNGFNILRSSNRLGLRSEASTRFEKQLHPELAMRAQRIASRMLVELCGARLVPGTIDVAAKPPPDRQVQLRSSRTRQLLGIEIDPSDASAYLERLGFEVEAEGDDLLAGVPVDRYEDVTREADLVEEVARIHGLDRLPATLPPAGNRTGRLARADALRRRVEDALRDIGFNEIVSWGFTDAAVAERLRLDPESPDGRPIALSNPLSGEGSVMRTTLLGGLLDAARHNVSRGAERVLLFESGRVYLRSTPPEFGGPLAGVFPGELPPPAYEPHRVAALVVGSLRPPSWLDGRAFGAGGGGGRGEGFFELKGVLEDVCRTFGLEPRLAPGGEGFLHPGRAAQVELEGARAGWIGELHPMVATEFDLPGGFAFELDLAVMGEAGVLTERFTEVASFPPIYQDVAVVVSSDIPAERVTGAVARGAGELLRSARVFDVYVGDQLGPDRKSLALRLEFGAADRTLTDEEVAARRDAIREAVAEIGGALRE